MTRRFKCALWLTLSWVMLVLSVVAQADSVLIAIWGFATGVWACNYADAKDNA